MTISVHLPTNLSNSPSLQASIMATSQPIPEEDVLITHHNETYTRKCPPFPVYPTYAEFRKLFTTENGKRKIVLPDFISKTTVDVIFESCKEEPSTKPDDLITALGELEKWEQTWLCVYKKYQTVTKTPTDLGKFRERAFLFVITYKLHDGSYFLLTDIEELLYSRLSKMPYAVVVGMPLMARVLSNCGTYHVRLFMGWYLGMKPKLDPSLVKQVVEAIPSLDNNEILFYVGLQSINRRFKKFVTSVCILEEEGFLETTSPTTKAFPIKGEKEVAITTADNSQTWQVPFMYISSNEDLLDLFSKTGDTEGKKPLVLPSFLSRDTANAIMLSFSPGQVRFVLSYWVRILRELLPWRYTWLHMTKKAQFPVEYFSDVEFISVIVEFACRYNLGDQEKKIFTILRSFMRNSGNALLYKVVDGVPLIAKLLSNCETTNRLSFLNTWYMKMPKDVSISPDTIFSMLGTATPDEIQYYQDVKTICSYVKDLLPTNAYALHYVVKTSPTPSPTPTTITTPITTLSQPTLLLVTNTTPKRVASPEESQAIAKRTKVSTTTPSK